MPAFIDGSSCDNCRGRAEPECQRLCPADLFRLGSVTARVEIVEPEACWECFACVKACPTAAIHIRGAADVVPLGARLDPCRTAASIAWTVTCRNGASRSFQFPIRSTPWGSIEPFKGMPPADVDGLKNGALCGGQKISALARNAVAGR